MTEWVEHDEDWTRAEEQLGNGYWLLCFRKTPASTALPDAWINVLAGKWELGHGAWRDIECHIIEHCDLLTLECIMIEMRKKYAHSDAVQP